jgi:hypothetical protein
MKVEIISNASGDWTVVKLNDRVFTSGHSISKWDMIDLLETMGHEVTDIEISDEEMESNY